jgi:hypothetical protein
MLHPIKFIWKNLSGRFFDKKVAIFCQTKRIFAGRSNATIQKNRDKWRIMRLWEPRCVPTNWLY